MNSNIRPRPERAPNLESASGWVVATVVLFLNEIGFWNMLQSGPVNEDKLATLFPRGYPADAFFRYASTQGLIRINERKGVRQVFLTKKGLNECASVPWLQLFVLGYGELLTSLIRLSPIDHVRALRDFPSITKASAALALFDSWPSIARLIALVGCPSVIADVGCGTAATLVRYAETFPKAKVIGAEPDTESRRRAKKEIEKAGLSQRIKIERAGIADFHCTRDTELIVLSFVLHELAGQTGVEGVISALRRIKDGCPLAKIIVVEVDRQNRRKATVKRYTKQYYSNYELVHSLTQQMLLSKQVWRDVFAKAGLRILKEDTANREADPTGMMISFLLS